MRLLGKGSGEKGPSPGTLTFVREIARLVEIVTEPIGKTERRGRVHMPVAGAGATDRVAGVGLARGVGGGERRRGRRGRCGGADGGHGQLGVAGIRPGEGHDDEHEEEGVHDGEDKHGGCFVRSRFSVRRWTVEDGA